MASSNFKFFLSNQSYFSKITANCYGNANLSEAAPRFVSLYDLHLAQFNAQPDFFSSPGRIELCGNHTDHNNGQVLCAAITVDTLAAVTPNDKMTATVCSVGYPHFTVDLSDLTPDKSLYGTSDALAKGVAAFFVKNGLKIGGFDITSASNVFKGAGVSSSASFELLVAEVLNVYYNNGVCDAIFKARAAQYAENVFFGKPCGLMDQSAIALGGVSYIDFESTSAPKVQSIPWHLADKTSIVLVNTGGDHADLTDDYAAIRSEMENVAAFFGKKTLRFVEESQVIESIPQLQKKCSDRAILRALHFFTENKRVQRCADAVHTDDLDGFLNCIEESGNSSYKLLQNCYSTSSPAQRIPLGLALANRQQGLQACRVHGGGFAGTILCFVQPKHAESFVANMAAVFGEDNVFHTGIRNSGAELIIKSADYAE